MSSKLDSCIVRIVRFAKGEIPLLVQDTEVLRKHLNIILSTAFLGKWLGWGWSSWAAASLLAAYLASESNLDYTVEKSGLITSAVCSQGVQGPSRSLHVFWSSVSSADLCASVSGSYRYQLCPSAVLSHQSNSCVKAALPRQSLYDNHTFSLNCREMAGFTINLSGKQSVPHKLSKRTVTREKLL